MDPALPDELSHTTEIAARLYVSIGRLTRSLRRRDPAALTHGELSALATLVAAGPQRLGDLATKEGVTAPTLSRVVANLTDNGYVRREQDPSDRRASLVVITDAGAAIVANAWMTVADELRRRVELLGDAEREAMLMALPALERLTAWE